MLKQAGLLGVAFFILSSAANAQDAANADNSIQLDPIYIDLGQSKIEAEKSGRAYTVITGEQLEQSQTRYVADALRQVPGFAVSRSGSYGGVTQVRVRGAEAHQELIVQSQVLGRRRSDAHDTLALVFAREPGLARG